MKKISLQGIADFMTASEVKRRTIVNNFKNPKLDEVKAMIKYYREAREAITIFHTRGNDIDYLKNRAINLHVQALANTGPTRARLKNNARGVRQYFNNFKGKQFIIKGRLSSEIICDDVRISITPDLYVEENGDDKIIKLEFKSIEPSLEYMKIIAQCLFMSTNGRFKPKNCLYIDVPRGNIYIATKATSRLQRNVEAACASISDIWDKI